MRNWRTEILAFFDHPITNGYTEALNGATKVINRMGRGYSFEVLRGRVLFGGELAPQQIDWKHCVCCGTEVEEITTVVDHIRLAADLPPRAGSLTNIAVICFECHQRFHNASAT